ncbi:hypothetical protein [Schumannella luteola]
MRAALPQTEPDGRQAGRPRGRVLLLALAVTALALFSGVAPAAADSAVPEPRIPQPVLLLGECDATLSVVDLVPGRSYDISVTDASGAAVYAAAGLVASADVLDSFVTVPAGIHYWSVTDSAAPEFSASRTVDVAPCAAPEPEPEPAAPEVDAQPAGPSAAAEAPSIEASLVACDLLGASDITVSATGLAAGTYPAGVALDGAPVPGVPNDTLTAADSATVFADLPNGADYTVWLKDPTGRVVATTSIALPICDLPTLDDPVDGTVPDDTAGDPRTLAPTGLPVAGLLLAGLGTIQGGALVAGVGVLRRRR